MSFSFFNKALHIGIARFISLLTLPLGLTVLAPAQSVIISEFMASNAETLNDEDGNSEDWIELYNQSGSALNLSGWYLTDDSTNLTKWAIPDITLNSGQLIVIFASDKNRQDPGGELHTNFKLSASGEYLAIVRPDGITVEHDYGAAYPQQVTDISYGLQQSTSSLTLLSSGASAKYLVPSNGNDDVNDGQNVNSWISSGFNDNSWSNATTGLGYATANNDPYDAFIGTDIQSTFYNQGSTVTSVYIRIPFTVADPTSISSLTLNMKYDDGFVAYLNGDPEIIAEALNPPSDELDYQSNATDIHNDGDAVVDVPFTIDPSNLLVGNNLLCIHGLNRSATSSDSLFLPTLEAATISGSSTAAYFTSPTPNAANSGGSASPGPLVRSVTNGLLPLNPGAGNVVIEADVVPTLNPVSSVTLHTRVMYGSESTLAMNDNGTGADLLAGDGIYTASMSTSGMTAGQMIRWRVNATDSSNNSTKSPPFNDPLDSPEYYGTIAEDPSIASSNLPVIHWFTADPNGATTVSGSRGSIFYLNQFYDNIQADRHGQSTGGFPKKSYDIDFNKGDRFLPEIGGKRAKDINLITNWADKSKTRNFIGYEMMRLSGHPAHYAFPVRIQQNAAFFSTADLIEDGDDRYLDRVGLDENGALYKMYNSFDSSSSGVNKKTRKEEGNSDLAAVISGLGLSGDAKLRYGYDNINIPGTINYLAALDMTNNRDHGHKNYYVYRDTNGTGEWRPLIWDIDLNLGRNWISGPAYFDDNFNNNNLRAGPSNRLKQFIFNDPTLNDMFRRRVRTLMDQMYGPTSAPSDYLPGRVNALVALIDPNNNNANTGTDDADLDYQKWGSWGNNNPMRAAANRILNEYLPSRRAQLYGLSEVPSAQPSMPNINIVGITFNPASNGATPDQSGEYFILLNPNSYAVDCSDWVISGGVSLTLPPGAVIPAGGTLYIGRDAVGFRSRTITPTADEKRYLISGYDGQLSARGETINLHDNFGNLIKSETYPGNETLVQAYLRVSEIMFAPAAPTTAELNSIPTLSASDFEFIELINNGPNNLDLSNAKFTEGVSMTFAGGTTLAPGQRVIVVANQAAFELRYGNLLPVVGQFTGNLNNAGEQLQIVDAVGENVLEFSYSDAWYPQTDGTGYSLVLLNPTGTAVTDFDLAPNWGISQFVGGDPAASPAATSMTFEFWKNQTFTESDLLDPAITGNDADPDADGLNTLLEYALGLDPLTKDATLGYQSAFANADGNDYLSMTLRRQKNAIDLSYEIQVSSTLSGWDATTFQIGSASDNGDGTETITIRDFVAHLAGDQRFIRLHVTLNP
ncbi:MAG: lamin tail domain-containing protein [Verrucomicrobiaceae bacterium]